MLKKTKIIIRDAEAIVNTKTGEVVGMVDLQTINTSMLNAGFRISYNISIEKFLRSSHQSSTSKMVSFLLSNMNEHTNKLDWSTKKIGECFGTSQQFVSQCFKKLKADNTIKTKPNVVMINPSLFFSGNNYKFNKLLNEWNSFND